MARSPVPSKKMDSTTSQMIRTHTMSKNGARHTYPGGSGPSATRTESAQNPAHRQTSATSCRKSHRSILFAAEPEQPNLPTPRHMARPAPRAPRPMRSARAALCSGPARDILAEPLFTEQPWAEISTNRPRTDGGAE